MSRTTTILLWLYLLSLLPSLAFTQTLTGYEYWFDEDFKDKISGSLSGTTDEINTFVDASKLDVGIHKINVRIKQSDGSYSAITSSLFLKIVNGEKHTLEYWFDNLTKQMESRPIAYTDAVQVMDLDLSDNTKFPLGFHKLNMRVTINSQPSAIYSSSVLKLNSGVATSLEYWFDNSLDNAQTLPYTSAEDGNVYLFDHNIDLSKVSLGKHTLNVRAVSDTRNTTSAVYSTSILKMPVGTISMIEYWLDDKIKDSKTVSVKTSNDGTAYLFLDEFDLTKATPGHHRLYCRAVSDSKCMVSAVTMTPILVKPIISNDAKVIQYTVAVDDETAMTYPIKEPADEVEITHSLDASKLAKGQHSVTMSFYNSSLTCVTDSAPFSVNTLPYKLSTPDPSSFRAADITENGFTATWGKVDGALYYDILVKKVGGAYENPDFDGGSTGTSIEVYGLQPGTSYLFQVRARNDNYSQRSDWSPSIPKSINTAMAGSTPVQLNISNYNGFDGSTPLEVGKSYIYNIRIVNNASAMWTGDFYLKEGSNLIKKWTNVTVPNNAAQPLECYYTPDTEGTKYLVLYYCTKGTNSEIPVTFGDGPNSLMVRVNRAEDPSADLRLAEAINCPNTVNWNTSTDITTKVLNRNDKDWTGTLYLIDNEQPITAKFTTIKAGKTYTLSASKWTPSIGGTHSISIYYLTDKNMGMELVNANGFANPLLVEVTNADIPKTAKDAVLTLITKECAPHVLNDGDMVFFHYRITDAEGKPLSGVKAFFTCTGTKKKEFVESTLSDDEGYATLSIEAGGDNSFAERGESVTFICTGLIDSEQNWIELRNGNSADHELTLTYHEGNKFSRAVGFDNVESFSFTLNRGVTGEASFCKIVSASASLSFPLTTTLKWEDEKFLTTINSESKLEGNAGVDINSIASIGVNVHGGMKESTTYNWNKPGRTALAISLSWLESTLFFRAGVKKGNGYFDPIIENGPDLTTFWGFTPKLKSDFKLVQSWPTSFNIGVGTLFPMLQETVFLKQNTYKLGLEASFKMDPKVIKYRRNKSTLYGINRELKVKASGNFARLAGNVSPANLTIWGPIGNFVTKFDNMYYNVFNNSNFSNFGINTNFNLSVEEEEMYTTSSHTTVEEVSQELGLEAAVEISTEKIGEYIIPEWLNIEGSTLTEGMGKYGFTLGAGLSWSWKMSSKGPWAAHLQNLAKSEEGKKHVRNLFPVFGDEYMIQAPITYYQMLTDDYGMKEALSYAASQSKNSYDISEAFKIEQQESEKVEFMASIPLANWWPLYLTMDLGFTLDFKHYPSVTYYSVPDQRFFPVIFRSSNALAKMAKNATSFLHNEISNIFSDNDKEEIREEYNKVGKRFEIYTVPDASTLLTNRNSEHYINSSAQRIRSKHSMIVEQQQKDICTFTFAINDTEPNFSKTTSIEFSHIYPAGCLLGRTAEDDTLFVVSEVCELTAIQGSDTLKTTQQGEMTIETTIGADDLTPFGFAEDQPLDVYYSDNGEIWQYLGPAGTPLKVNKLGAFMMATSMKNDTVAPQIVVMLDEDSGLMNINVSDNIGVRLSSLQVFVNGERKVVDMINQSNFELLLTEEEMQYMLALYITVEDLAGNIGYLFQIFNMDKPENLGITDPEADADTEIDLDNDQFTVKGVRPGSIVTLFAIDGHIKARTQADATGYAQISLTDMHPGIYIVTLSEGKSKKLYLK